MEREEKVAVLGQSIKFWVVLSVDHYLMYTYG